MFAVDNLIVIKYFLWQSIIIKHGFIVTMPTFDPEHKQIMGHASTQIKGSYFLGIILFWEFENSISYGQKIYLLVPLCVKEYIFFAAFGRPS